MAVTFDGAVGFDSSDYFDGAAPSFGLDSILLEAAFGSNPLAATLSWTDITRDLKSASTDRGKSAELEQFQAGTATFTLRNEHYKYDPDNTSGPYAGQLLPMVPMRISALDSTSTRRYLFTGYVRPRAGWQTSYGPGNKTGANTSTATVSCVDFFGPLATKTLPSTRTVRTWTLYANSLLSDLLKFGITPTSTTDVPIPAFTGYRSGDLLSALVSLSTLPNPTGGWGVSGRGQTITQGYSGGANALQWVQRLAETEGGAVYVTRDGVIQFDERYAPFKVARQASPQVTFDDAGAAVSYSNDGFAKDYATLIYNRAEVTPTNLDTETAFDQPSIDRYTESGYSSSDVLMDNAAEALGRAQAVVARFKDPISTPSTLVLKPRRNNTVLDAALQRELRDRVTVKFKPPSAAAQVTTDVFVQHISHSIDVNAKTWDCTLGFESAMRPGDSEDSYLLLDDPVKGVLDGTRKLGI